ncbi:MAG: PEGA domain-containing protein [Polyangiales bacterium]
MRRVTALMFALGLFPAQARAQTASAQPAQATDTCSQGEARAAFEAGLLAFAERRWADAAPAFERALACRPLPVVNYNLALAYRGLGRRIAAIEAFQRYLDAPDPDATAERLQAIREEVAEMRRQVVELTVTVSPPSTQLRIDDRVYEAPGGAPLSFPPERPLRLDPGSHVLTWTAPEHTPVRWSEEFRAGFRDTRGVTLRPLREGRLVIESSVSDATVYVNRERVAVGRYQSSPMEPGRYEVELRADGYVPFVRRVDVGRTGVVRIDASLERNALPRWVIPVAVVGGALALGGIIAAVVGATSEGARPLYNPTWTQVVEHAMVTP